MRKKMLAGILMGAVVTLVLALNAQTVEKKEWKSSISDKGWTSDQTLALHEGGFGFAPKADKTYGWIENKERLPYSKNGEISIDISKLTDANITIQLQTFNEKGGFINAVPLLKELTELGKKTVSLEKIEVDPKTKSVNFKIWIGSGNKQGSVEIKEISYKY